MCVASVVELPTHAVHSTQKCTIAVARTARKRIFNMGVKQSVLMDV